MSDDNQSVESGAEAHEEVAVQAVAESKAVEKEAAVERKFTPTQDAEKIRELREENKQRRLENKKIEAALSETQKKLQEIELKTQERLITAELKMAASKYKLRDFSDAKSLADLSGVKVLDNGDVAGVDEAIAALKETKPYLFDLGQTTIAGSSPVRSSSEMKKDVRAMSSAEYRAAKSAMLRNGR